jgi:hypothetical protein
MNEPKILIIDIETAPTVAYVWGLFDQNISIDQIKQDSYVLCWAAKWYGKREILFDSIKNYPLFKKNPTSDLEIAKSAHKLMSEADIIVAHNGDRFDIKWLNYIFLKHGLDPVPPFKTVDTLSVAKGNFLFTSNKLDFISQRLGVGSKVKHEGFGLWVKCMAGDNDAWKRMEKYNKGDVVVLEGVYTKLRPFMKRHPIIRKEQAKDFTKKCPLCSSFKLEKNGFLINLTGRFQRYKCLDCRRWTHDKKPTERFNHALV